jgi:hypothetical protein
MRAATRWLRGASTSIRARTLLATPSMRTTTSVRLPTRTVPGFTENSRTSGRAAGA